MHLYRCIFKAQVPGILTSASAITCALYICICIYICIYKGVGNNSLPLTGNIMDRCLLSECNTSYRICVVSTTFYMHCKSNASCNRLQQDCNRLKQAQLDRNRQQQEWRGGARRTVLIIIAGCVCVCVCARARVRAVFVRVYVFVCARASERVSECMRVRACVLACWPAGVRVGVCGLGACVYGWVGGWVGW